MRYLGGRVMTQASSSLSSRSSMGMAAALWTFAVALLLGFGEVLGDTLIDQVSGPGGVLAGLLLAIGLPVSCGLLGYSLADHWGRPSKE